MSNKQDIFTDDESLEKDSPLLHSISKENPFTVPENYFESLPSEIIEKCQEAGNGLKPFAAKWQGILTTLLVYKWKLLTVTGCVALLCFLAIRLNNRPMSYEAMAQNIPDSLIVEHLDNNIAAINESTLEDFQDAENIKSESDSTNSDQDIITYLVDNNISVTDISNE